MNAKHYYHDIRKANTGAKSKQREKVSGGRSKRQKQERAIPEPFAKKLSYKQQTITIMNNDRNNDRYGDSQNRQQQNPGNDNNWRDERRDMAPSDNDDFNNQGWPEDDEKSANPRSRTFNENEATYDDEQREGSNAGTRNNNWDANDMTQRTSHIHDDEQWDRPNQPYDSGSGL